MSYTNLKVLKYYTIVAPLKPLLLRVMSAMHAIVSHAYIMPQHAIKCT